MNLGRSAWLGLIIILPHVYGYLTTPALRVGRRPDDFEHDKASELSTERCTFHDDLRTAHGTERVCYLRPPRSHSLMQDMCGDYVKNLCGKKTK